MESFGGNFSLWVFSNAVEGREDEFRRWHDGHIRDVVSVPGFSGGRRFSVHPVGRGELRHSFVTVYQMEATNSAAAAAAVQAMTSAGFDRSDALAPGGVAAVFETCSPRVENPTARPSGDFIFVSANQPVPGREAEYNDWYNQRHVAEVVGVEGFTRGRRLTVRQKLLGEPTHDYLVVYHMSAADRAEADAAMQRGAEAGLSYSNDIAKGGISMLLLASSPEIPATRKPVEA